MPTERKNQSVSGLSKPARELLARIIEGDYILTPTSGWRIITPWKHLGDTSLDWSVEDGAAKELLANGCIGRMDIPRPEAYLPTEKGRHLAPAAQIRWELEQVMREHHPVVADTASAS
jgi:hypothetical protein